VSFGKGLNSSSNAGEGWKNEKKKAGQTIGVRDKKEEKRGKKKEGKKAGTWSFISGSNPTQESSTVTKREKKKEGGEEGKTHQGAANCQPHVTSPSAP